MRIFAGKPEDMGKQYAAIVQEARKPGLPEEEELTKFFRDMITITNLISLRQLFS